MRDMNTYQHWKMHCDTDNILWLGIDRKDKLVNTINEFVIRELNTIIDSLSSSETPAGVVIYSAKKTGFIAGADIEQFIHLKDDDTAFNLIRAAQTVFDRLEMLPFPTIAMIQGFCLGGGLELSLACRYRVAEESEKTRLGLPEVKLGIHPGWGGTVRLPRLIGAVSAMGLILTGNTVSGRAAAKIGFVDAAVPERQLKRAACYFILNKPEPHHPNRLQRLAGLSVIRPWLARKFFNELGKKVSEEHYPAPYAAVKAWVSDGAVGEQAMITEAKSISKLFLTDTCKNLVRVFFLQERMKKLGKSSDFKPKHIHVIGAGVMGGDIAAWCALQGMQVTLQDRAPEYIAPAIKRAYALYEKKLKKPYLIQEVMDRLRPDPRAIGVPKADMVIEAIYENLEAKQTLYREIEPCLKAGAILATNTSTIPLEELNTCLKNKSNLVGIHFFNPVAMMQLVEVVKGRDTDSDVVNKATSFVAKINRLPLPVKSSPGFLVNRALLPYLLECINLLEEGVPAAAIDAAAEQFGMPMGPVELADTVGLDVCLSAATVLIRYYGGNVPVRLQEMVDQKALGRKTGRGFYNYKRGKPQKDNVPKGYHPPKDLTDRLILIMLNEAMACLRESVIDDVDLLDAGMIFGTGFAPFRGGPIHYAKTLGKETIVGTLKILEKKYGERFKPDEGWSKF